MMQAYANTVSRTDADVIRVPETNGIVLLISRANQRGVKTVLWFPMRRQKRTDCL